jgi:hypothetical protein
MLCNQLIHDVFTGARMVECDPALGLICIWYGGPSLVNVFRMEDLEPVFAWTNNTLESPAEAQADARAWLEAQRVVQGPWLRDGF